MAQLREECNDIRLAFWMIHLFVHIRVSTVTLSCGNGINDVDKLGLTAILRNRYASCCRLSRDSENLEISRLAIFTVRLRHVEE
jgi:hypothetical protein